MTSHIYIITDGRNTKIGITTDLGKRVAAYKTHNPNFRLFRTFEADLKEAKWIEKVIIGAFKDDAVGEGKEWFAVGPETVERYVSVLMSKPAGAEVLPSMHDIPLTSEAYTLQEAIRKDIDDAGRRGAYDNGRRLWELRRVFSELGSTFGKAESPAARRIEKEIEALSAKLEVADRDARLNKERLSELFADRVGLGMPSHKVPDGTIRVGGMSVDWEHCSPDSEIVRSAVRGDFRMPLDDHTEQFCHMSRLASGHWAALWTARVSMPYLPKLAGREAWEEISAAAESMGWRCSIHDEWSWHSPGETGLVLYQRKTPVRAFIEQWEGSFRKWAVERRKALIMDAKGDKAFAKVLDDLADDSTFPLAVRSWDELLETYFDRYWKFEMPDELKYAYRALLEKWLSQAKGPGSN
jgi:hypothetical protein